MYRVGWTLLAIAVVELLLLAAWVSARESGMLEGPPSYLGELLLAGIGGGHLLLGVGALRGAPNDELAQAEPRRLPLRLSRDETGSEGIVNATALLLVLVLGLGAATVISTYPRDFSQCWVCHSSGDGESNCDLDEKTPVVTFWLFLATCLVGSVGGLALAPMGVWSILRLRSLAQAAPPILEVSATRVCPGDTLELLAAQPGVGLCKELRVELRCLEESDYSHGSSTTTDTELVWRLVPISVQGRRTGPSQSVAAQVRVTVPLEAMHTFRSDHHRIRWELEVSSTMAGSSRHSSAHELEVSPVRRDA